MNSAEGPSFSGAPSPSIENQQPIQERSGGAGNAVLDRSDQDPSHRGGGSQPEDLKSMATAEEVAAQAPVPPMLDKSATQADLIESMKTTGEINYRAQFSPDEKLKGSQKDFEQPANQTSDPDQEYDSWKKESESLNAVNKEEAARIEQVTKAWGKDVDQQFQSNTQESAKETPAVEPPTKEANDTSQPETTLDADLEEPIDPNLVRTPTPEKVTPTQATTPQEMVGQVANPGDKLGELTYASSGEVFGEKYRVYTDKDGSPVMLKPDEEIARAQSHLENQASQSQQPEQNSSEPEKVEIPPQISQLIDNLEAGKVPTLLPNLARNALIKLGVTPAQLKEFESRAAWEEALAPLVSARASGRLIEHVDKPKPADAKPPEAKVDLNNKVKLTPAEMGQLIAEKQKEIDPTKAAEKISLADIIAEKSEGKPNRIFSAAEKARAKTAEIARAAALRTPGGKFIYNAAERYLNNFDWRDKEKIYWGAGIAVGFANNVALNMALPGVGSLINSVGSTATTHLLAGGINHYRLRGIERAIKFQAAKLGSDASKALDAKSFRDQYDAASRLLRSNGQEAYQAEMDRISKDFLDKLGYKDTTAGNQMMSEMISDLNQELQSKIFKYDKANERLRSFAAGMKVGAITNGLSNQIFDLDKYIEGKVGLADSPPSPDNIPTLSQEQIDLINKIHEDPEAWKTFTSLTPEQWQDVGRLYFAEQSFLAETGAGDLIEKLTSADTGSLVEVHQGDTVANIFKNNGFNVTYTPSDSDLVGGHILANHELLADTHDRLVDAGVAAGEFPTRPKVIELIEASRAGDTQAFHDLQANLDWLPVNEKMKILSANDIADVAEFFERKAAAKVAAEAANQ